MTDIPGTGKPSALKPELRSESKIISVVNVAEIKKGPLPSTFQKDAWYNEMWFWILVGGAGGVVFILLGLIKKQFLILATMGPVIGFVSWEIRKIFKKYSKKIDVTSK